MLIPGLWISICAEHRSDMSVWCISCVHRSAEDSVILLGNINVNAPLSKIHSCTFCSTASTSIFSSWMYHSHMNQSQRSTLPLQKCSWEEHRSRLWGSASPPALSSPPRLQRWQKTKKDILKRGQNEKNCSSTSPWTRGLRMNLESAGQMRTPPSARALPQHKTMQEHATSPADRWEGARGREKKQKVCVVGWRKWFPQGKKERGKEGKGLPPSQFRLCYLVYATVQWCIWISRKKLRL